MQSSIFRLFLATSTVWYVIQFCYFFSTDQSILDNKEGDNEERKILLQRLLNGKDKKLKLLAAKLINSTEDTLKHISGRQNDYGDSEIGNGHSPKQKTDKVPLSRSKINDNHNEESLEDDSGSDKEDKNTIDSNNNEEPLQTNEKKPVNSLNTSLETEKSNDINISETMKQESLVTDTSPNRASEIKEENNEDLLKDNTGIDEEQENTDPRVKEESLQIKEKKIPIKSDNQRLEIEISNGTIISETAEQTNVITATEINEKNDDEDLKDDTKIDRERDNKKVPNIDGETFQKEEKKPQVNLANQSLELEKSDENDILDRVEGHIERDNKAVTARQNHYTDTTNNATKNTQMQIYSPTTAISPATHVPIKDQKQSVANTKPPQLNVHKGTKEVSDSSKSGTERDRQFETVTKKPQTVLHTVGKTVKTTHMSKTSSHTITTSNATTISVLTKGIELTTSKNTALPSSLALTPIFSVSRDIGDDGKTIKQQKDSCPTYRSVIMYYKEEV